MASIELRGVTKRFRDVPVIKPLDLEIRDGEFFTFVGPSGCGKSTVLNMIAGLEPVTSGTISFDGKPVGDLPPRDRDVAMVFQSYALYPHMDVFDNLAFPLRMKKVGEKRIREEVERTASFLGLEGLLRRKPSQLSGGQRQRVALGRAIIRRPRVFLMDEPLSNLDARLRVETRAELKRLHRELRITTVYVTHDQAEAMSLSDRIAVLEDGECRQCGEPMEVYLRPASVFVAGFIGSPPMNFMEAAVEGRDPFRVRMGGAVFEPRVRRLPKGGAVTVGIRPEDLPVGASGDGPEAEADIIEAEGPATWVDVKWAGTRLKGKAREGERIYPQGRVRLAVSSEKLHVFDVLSGERL
ncbi:MAG: sn-glycerol-3-phosphate ABC transporter ATP-binding protein UgpC [Thermodesulfovibrionales bacterium]